MVQKELKLRGRNKIDTIKFAARNEKEGSGKSCMYQTKKIGRIYNHQIEMKDRLTGNNE